MTLATLAARGSEAAVLAMLVHSLRNPVDARVTLDCLMSRVNQDHLIKLVSGILSNPVRIEDTETAQLATSTLLSNRAVRTLVLQRVHTMGLGLTIRLTLHNRALATTTLHTNAVDNKSLLGLDK